MYAGFQTLAEQTYPLNKDELYRYFKNLKIDEAKIMIREGEYNFTEIAHRLGYSSIHYFSRHFKKATGMTPSEYAYSVKIKI